MTPDEIAYLRTISPYSPIAQKFRGKTVLPAEMVHLLLDEIETLSARTGAALARIEQHQKHGGQFPHAVIEFIRVDLTGSQ